MSSEVAGMALANATSIDVLIVGAGLGGLFCAIELKRQGHHVTVLEAKEGLDGIGDFVGIGVSVTRQFAKWPGMTDKYHEIRYKPVVSFLKYDGELLGGPFPEADAAAMPLPVPRPKLQRFLYDHAVSLDIPVIFGKRVVKYYEKEEEGKAGVIITGGEHFEASLVVAADGVGSKSWQAVTGSRSEAKSSGFAVYRTAFSTSRAHQDPHVAENFPVLPKGDEIRMYLGPNTHAITLISKDITTWLLTHKDTGSSTTSWSARISADKVIEELSKSEIAWDPALLGLIQQTPPDSVVDWRLLWRNPNPRWSSESGRIMQLGDAAHSFLPTSANGGTQACEDGISLAACLKMAGSAREVPLATKVHFALRFPRVSSCQRSGFRNREMWHNTDMEEAKKHPEKLAEMAGRWITNHDPEQYVYDNWSGCVDALRKGKVFQNTNIPPGYTVKPWTIEDVLDPNGKDSCLEDEGDWT